MERLAKPGDQIRIIDNMNEHLYNIGDTVIVTEWDEFDEEDSDAGVETYLDSKANEHWFVRHTDYVIVNRFKED